MNELAEVLAVTAELTGTDLSKAAAVMLVMELDGYDRAQVLGALRKCRRELKGRLTLAAILERLDDGRPGVEEAWSMMPFDERQSVVWSDEMAEAFGICGPLLGCNDKVAARMAFKEAYARLVAKARDVGKVVRWTPSLGHDPRGRAAVVNMAAAAGRLTYEQAATLVPELTEPLALRLIKG